MSDGEGTATRRLMLLRHRKSAWPEGVDDRLRPIAGRGRKAASLMGAYLAGEKLVPDLVLVSTAQRTWDTWERVAGKLPEGVEVRLLDGLYEAGAEDILEILAGVEPDRRSLLVVGHNPGLQELALRLAGSGDEEARRSLAEKFPTAALAIIDLAADDWRLAAGSGRLSRFVTPRSLA